MAIRLSKRGWNNVLIFASMFMIVLFNYTHKMFSEGDRAGGEVRSLLPANSLVQTIDFNGIQFERLGTGWRTLTDLEGVTVESPKSYIDVWSQQPFVTLTSPPTVLQTAKSSVVVIWAAGESGGWVFEFLIDATEQSAYVKSHHTDTWYQVPYRQLEQLIPAVLLSH